VLGAAHCGGAVGQFVTIGGGTTVAEVVSQRIHPNWNSANWKNDFYLYRLRSPVTTSGARVVVNTNGASPSDGQSLTTMGFGTTSEGGPVPSILRDVVLPKSTDTACRSAYGSTFDSTLMFCAGEAGKDSCQGDSGGPIVIRNGDIHTITGVVSFGIGCARPGIPGVYARVSAVTSWISSVACVEWGSSVVGLCGNTNAPIAPPTPLPVAPPTLFPVEPPTPLPDSLPTPPPVVPPTPSPVSSPTSGGICTTLTVELFTDDYPSKNSVTLKNGRRTLWNFTKLKANRMYKWSRCINNNSCTVFEVNDSWGDGLMGDGNIKVTYGSEILWEGYDIGYGFFMDLGNRCRPR